MPVPIKPIEGIELELTEVPGISKVKITNNEPKQELSWDRFVRLQAAAEAVIAVNAKTVIDAGGYDGALGFFLPGVEIDLIDPATTGGSVLSIPVEDGVYDAVVAVDVLEHIEPKDRPKALSELARVARQHVILNYPCQDSKAAQELVLTLTNNPLVREHVQWELPDSDWVLGELAQYGYKGTVKPHTSIAVWLGQYVALNMLPERARELNQHLVENYAEEPCSRALYHLVVCERGCIRQERATVEEQLTT